jgi:NADH-quinone oxidoreductase subunit M
MLQGPLTKPENAALQDLNWREVFTLAPLIALFFVIGLFPNLFLDKINPSAQAVVTALNAPRPAVTLAVDSPR